MANLPCIHCNSSDGVQSYEDGLFCFSCKRKQYMGTRVKELKVSDDVPYPSARNKNTMHGSIFNLAPLFPHNVKLLEYAKIVGSNGIFNWEVELYSRNKNKWYTIYDCIELQIHNLKGEYCGSEYRLFSGDRKSISDYVGGSIFLTAPLVRQTTRVITEDIASAINVSNVCPSLALMGTSLPKKCSEKLINILDSADQFIIWLDSDTPGKLAAKKIIKTISQFKHCVNISTPLDPKKYTHSEIRDILRGHI